MNPAHHNWIELPWDAGDSVARPLFTWERKCEHCGCLAGFRRSRLPGHKWVVTRDVWLTRDGELANERPKCTPVSRSLDLFAEASP